MFNPICIWCDSAPPIWGNRSPLAAQSKVSYRKHSSCASMSQWAWWGTDGTREVGTHLMGPSHRPSWTFLSMGNSPRATPKHIHTGKTDFKESSGRSQKIFLSYAWTYLGLCIAWEWLFRLRISLQVINGRIEEHWDDENKGKRNNRC